jgi:bacterioferritin-associated ferredoxin
MDERTSWGWQARGEIAMNQKWYEERAKIENGQDVMANGTQETPVGKRCGKCGAPGESTIHQTMSQNVEIRNGAHVFVDTAPLAIAADQLAQAAEKAQETGCDKCGDARCMAIKKLRTALANYKRVREG